MQLLFGEVDIRRIQLVELDILRHCMEIFSRHNLRYYAIGGTAIGAIRHAGFIPWDDDIDIGMPRPDYEKFISIANMELPSYLFLQHYTTEAEYPLIYAKIRNSKTTFIEEPLCKMHINHGIFIDIFPIDGIKRKYRKTVYQELAELKIHNTFFAKKEKIAKKVIKYFPLQIVKFLLSQNQRDVLRKIDSYIMKEQFDNSDNVVNFYGAYRNKEVVPREYFGDGALKIFEDVYIKVPTKYDLYLSHIYGDYMRLPALDKQMSNHITTIIDTEKSYMEYMEKLAN